MKASSLLPLNVPIGKPILSCNATGLLQAQINLDGIIYDCDRSAITKSCPRINENNLAVDECHGETLECDVNMRLDSRSVTCTNGTLISNHPIVCKSATLTERKNVLNCSFKNSNNDNSPTSTLSPTHSTIRPVQDRTTSKPIITPTTSLIPPPPVEENNDDINDIDVRYAHNKNRRPIEVNGLPNELKRAMEAVFPHELLSSASLKMYLPPKSTAGQIPKDVKSQLEGVFPHELFALSQTDDLNSNEARNGNNNEAQGLSLQQEETRDSGSQTSFTQNLPSQWNLDLNRNAANSGPSFKTNPNRLAQRFQVDEADNEDRLIFSP